MPLQEQPVTIPFVKGEQTKVDPKLVTDGSLLLLKNAHFSKEGTPQRRDAWTALTGATMPVTPRGMCAFNDELLTVAGKTLFSYSPAGQEMVDRGTVSPCRLTRASIDRHSSYADQIDAAAQGRYRCYVWRDVDLVVGGLSNILGIRAIVLDSETGAVVFGPSYLSLGFTSTPSVPNPSNPRVVGVSATFPSDAPCFIVTWTDATSRLMGAAIDVTTMRATASVPLRTSATATTGRLDLISVGGAAIAVHSTSAGTNSVEADMLKFFNGALMLQGSAVSCALQATLPRASVGCVAVVAFQSSTVAAFALGTSGASQGIWAGNFTWSSAGLAAGTAMVSKDTTLGPSSVSSIVGVLDGNAVRVFADASADMSATSPGNRTPIRTLSVDANNNTVSAPADFATSWAPPHGPSGPYIAAKPFIARGEVFLPAFIGSAVSGDANLQNTWLLLDSDGSVVARALYGTYGFWKLGGVQSKLVPPSIIQTSSLAIEVPVLERGQLSFDGGANVNVTPVGVSTLKVDFSPFFSSARVGDAHFFAGGLLTQYDGQSVTEAAFHCFPEGLTTSVAAGSLTGTYQYCALYEWTDAAGQRHQSAPSVPVTATPSSQNVTVTIPSLGITARTGVTVVVFRTVNNGTTFYRLNSAANALSNTPSAAASATVTYTDSASDASIQANEILYTTAGALENLGPGPCAAVAAHQKRLWMVGLEDGTEFRFSQQVVRNTGLQFNEALSDRIPQGQGALCALGVLDDKMVLYTPGQKFIVFGQGPTADGLQNGYSTPQAIASEQGCIEARSVVTLDQGQVYQSSRGLFLLNRALQDEYLGAPVEPLVDGATIVAAVVDEKLQQARFIVQRPDGAVGASVGAPGLELGVAGYVLAYDATFGQWSHHDSEANILFSAACQWAGVCTYALATPNVPAPSGALGATVGAPGIVLSPAASTYAILRDAPGAFRDLGASYIPTTHTTGWIRLADLSGFERVKRLVVNGSFGSDSELSIGVAVNYKDPIVYTETFSSTEDAAEEGVLQVRHHIKTQKCQAVRFTLTDTPGSGLGQGCSLTGITLLVGIKKGVAKLKAAAST